MNIHTVYDFVSVYFRHRRMRDFESTYRLTSSVRILDVGGTSANWRFIQQKANITLLNLTLPQEKLPENITAVSGDGCHIQYGDHAVDIVYSNSVIEHLGTEQRRARFAQEVQRVGQSYYVQTPNRAFPIEPHYLTPGIHFLPKRWQVRLLRNFTLWGWITRPSLKECQAMVSEITLLDFKAMQELFPKAVIQKEKFMGCTKSLIATYHAKTD